jgi:hypothetical protein
MHHHVVSATMRLEIPNPDKGLASKFCIGFFPEICYTGEEQLTICFLEELNHFGKN